METSGLSPAAPIVGSKPSTNKTYSVFMRRWILTKRISCRMLQSSTEPVITNLFVPSDLLVEGHVSGLGTVHPLLTLNGFGTRCDVVT